MPKFTSEAHERHWREAMAKRKAANIKNVDRAVKTAPRLKEVAHNGIDAVLKQLRGEREKAHSRFVELDHAVNVLAALREAQP